MLPLHVLGTDCCHPVSSDGTGTQARVTPPALMTLSSVTTSNVRQFADAGANCRSWASASEGRLPASGSAAADAMKARRSMKPPCGDAIAAPTGH